MPYQDIQIKSWFINQFFYFNSIVENYVCSSMLFFSVAIRFYKIAHQIADKFTGVFIFTAIMQLYGALAYM